MVDNANNGTGEPAVKPDQGAPGTTGEPSGYDKGDYLARIGNEPEFAVTQVKEKDRKITELQEATKRYAGLDEYLNVLGGVDGLKQYVEVAYNINSNPELAGVVAESLRTGRVPTLQSENAGTDTDEDDLYMDPDVEIKKLRQQLAELRDSQDKQAQRYDQRFAQAETRSFKTGIDANIESIMDKYAVTPEIREAMSNAIMQRVQAAESRAKTGDASSLQILDSLSGADGVSTLRMFVSDIVDENMETIAAARQSKSVETVQAHSTGEPGTARTAGGGEPEQTVKPVGDWVQQVLEKNARKLGRDPSKVFSPM